jgi:cobalt-zinc-cadmium efflux system membrane fusion protein
VLLLVESRDASQIAGDQAAAAARVALARQQAVREQSLVAQGVSARADYETAQANLAVAQVEARRAAGAAGAVRLARDGRSVAVVSPITGRITALPANLGQFVPAETELVRCRSSPHPDHRQPAGQRCRAGARRGQGGTDERRWRENRGARALIDRRGQCRYQIGHGGDRTSGGSFVPGQLAQVRIFASGWPMAAA